MPTHARMTLAVFRRNFLAYFINPTGYVFITLFILLGAIAAFWQTSFFLNNLANLDQLNRFFPMLLLFFVPALTMSVWAEERRQGTDELLFTLPGHDLDIVLGKYLAVLGIYTVAVLFSLSHVIILAWLGDPDLGLMFATYLGYWLTGAALLSVGMVASQLTVNNTVAFILGAAFCSVFVFIENVETVFGEHGSTLVRQLGITQHFNEFGDGMITLTAVCYFLAVIAIMLFVNHGLISLRHAPSGNTMRAKFAMIAGIVFSVSRRERARKFVTVLAFPTSQIVLRIAALVVIAASLISLLARTGLSIDATAERLHTLQPQTRALIEAIPADRPVVIRAYFSPEVPEGYVTTRKNLLNVLHRFDDLAGDRLDVIVHDTEPFTRVATEAVDNYGIMPRPLVEVAASQRTTSDVFLGLVFTSGPEEFVIPFFDRGLPVEYELARSVRVVSQSDRNKLGIVATDVKLFGGFDFQTMSSSPDWSIVRELRKQYDVQQISPDGPYPDDLDAIVAVLPSSMSQSQLDALQDAILSGTPALLFDDPLPMFNPNLSPSLPRDAARNPFTSQGQPPAEPKGDFSALLASLGLSWRPTGIVWSAYNPHPGIADVNPEVVFVSRARDNEIPFNPESVISSGLQEVVAIFAGAVRADRPIAGSTLTATPLLQTGTVSGETDWNSIVQRGFLGVQLNPNPRRFQSPGAYTLAMRVTGAYPPAAAPPPGAEGEPPPPPPDLDVVFVSDVDIISETFFDLRRQGFEDFNFDNVTFALNCIDVLAGDESFVTLRKHRPRHRTLTLVERQKEEFALAQRAQIDTAEAEAESELQLAQQNLDQKVEELRQRTDLDEQTKAIMLRNLEEVENRRFRVTEASIQQDKQQQIDRAEAQMQTNIDRIQRSIKWLAAALPPIPTLILAIAFFAYRFNRERITVSERRLVEGT